MKNNDENMNSQNNDDQEQEIADLLKKRDVWNKTLKKLLIEIESKKKN